MIRRRVRRSSLTLRSRASGICYGCLSRIIRSRADVCEACELMCLLETARNCFHTFCSHRSLVFFPCSLCTQICNFANFLCLWKLLPHAVPPPHTFVQEWEAVRGGEGAMGLEETFSTLSRDICVMPILSTEYVPVEEASPYLLDCSVLVPLNQSFAAYSRTRFQMSKATGPPTVAMDAGGSATIFTRSF